MQTVRIHTEAVALAGGKREEIVVKQPAAHSQEGNYSLLANAKHTPTFIAVCSFPLLTLVDGTRACRV